MSSSEDLGKPGAGADLSAGLYTAPLLLAARNCSSLKRLLDFGEEVGSKEEVVRMVVEAGGVDQAVELAQAHANTALDAVEGWEGEQVEELRDLVSQVISQVQARYDQFFFIFCCHNFSSFPTGLQQLHGRKDVIDATRVNYEERIQKPGPLC